MHDIRNELRVKSIRWKTKKRVLERIDHVMLMEDTRQTRVAVLGWLENLEHMEKCPRRKRKTILYWKKLLREEGIDCTEAESLTADRRKWKEIVSVRMDHLERYEHSRGNRRTNEEGEIERNTIRQVWKEDLICNIGNCGKICRNKAGSTKKRMHKDLGMEFPCTK